MGDVIRNEVVAELVALVHRAPDLAGRGIDAGADRVANARGVDADGFALGGKLLDQGAVFVFVVFVNVVARRCVQLGTTLRPQAGARRARPSGYGPGGGLTQIAAPSRL